MKLDGLDHPKTLDLASRLDISLPQAIGHLELLWAFVAQKTPHGNVGKWADGAIARASHWTGDATVFVTALCDAGFIDVHPDCRLLIHDWHEHAPRWVVSKLTRAGENFFRLPVLGDKENSTKDSTADCSSDCTQDSSADSKPSLVKPSQAKSSQVNQTGSGEPENEYPEEFENVWRIYPKRSGGNSKKSAHKAWAARIKSGVSPKELSDGVVRYARYCSTTQKLNTEYVKQASTFFGSDEHYLSDWVPPRTAGGSGTTETPRERATRMAAERGIAYDPQ